MGSGRVGAGGGVAGASRRDGWDSASASGGCGAAASAAGWGCGRMARSTPTQKSRTKAPNPRATLVVARLAAAVAAAVAAETEEPLAATTAATAKKRSKSPATRVGSSPLPNKKTNPPSGAGSQRSPLARVKDSPGRTHAKARASCVVPSSAGIGLWKRPSRCSCAVHSLGHGCGAVNASRTVGAFRFDADAALEPSITIRAFGFVNRSVASCACTAAMAKPPCS
mmetsp:Transcript_43299/g.133755  ORF Transcript_43299/g.133755 Transcript_43299/m.133755 type:complete len:225 (-) Transcript_43299:1405-2079(-)